MWGEKPNKSVMVHGMNGRERKRGWDLPWDREKSTNHASEQSPVVPTKHSPGEERG